MYRNPSVMDFGAQVASRGERGCGFADRIHPELPSPEAARKFLYAFHDEERIEQAQAELPVGQVSYIPSESEPLRAGACFEEVQQPSINVTEAVICFRALLQGFRCRRCAVQWERFSFSGR